jgi:EmrB/QacA subfamily drug resistance transporter
MAEDPAPAAPAAIAEGPTDRRRRRDDHATGDGAASAAPTTLDVRHPWGALVALLVGLSIIIIDGSVVNVLLPDMVRDLGLTQTGAQWVNSIYSLVFAALLITMGLMSDRFGRRLLFLVGIAVFVAGSVGSGTASGPGVLIAFRALQAVGASMMMPSSVAVINVLFTGRSRAIAFGLWGAVFGGAAALGPLLGGFLAEYYSWRWAFLINLPIGVAAAVAVLRLLPESKGPPVAGFDLVGIVVSATGLALVVFGLIQAQDYGWWRAIEDVRLGPLHVSRGGLSVVPGALAAGGALLFLLVLWERRRARLGRPALVDLELFRVRRYGYGNVVSLVVSLGEFGILFVLPLWMQSVHGYSSLGAGAILATLAVGTLFAGAGARRLSARFGATTVVRIGMVLEVVGILGIGAALGVERNPWWLAVPLVVYGLGLGLAAAQLTNVVLEDVPPARSGQASAMNSTFRQVGSALGAACLGAILFGTLGARLDHELEGVAGLPAERRESLVGEVRSTAGQVIPRLAADPALRTEVEDAKVAYTEAARITALAAAGFVSMGLLVSFGLPRRPDEDTDPAPVPVEATPAGAR